MSKLKSILTAILLGFAVGGFAQADGDYYLYEVSNKKFFTHGESWGTKACVDSYGTPITWNSTEGSLKFKDNGLYLYKTGDNQFFTDNQSTGFKFTETEGGYYLQTGDGAMYAKLVDGTLLKSVMPTTDVAEAAVWQLKTKAERDAIVADYVNQNYANVIKAAGLEISSSDFLTELAKYTVVDKTSAIGTARFAGSVGSWTYTQVRDQGGQPAYGTDFCELWQETGYHTQTISGLTPGIYKVTVNGFERPCGPDASIALAEEGYLISTSTLHANTEQVALKSWYEDKGDGNDPDNTGQAVAKFNEGKYLNELYTYVGEDGKLTLMVDKHAHVGGNWVLFNNFTLTAYVNLEELKTSLADTYAKAETYATSKAPQKLITAINDSVAKYKAVSDSYTSIEEYETAIKAILSATGLADTYVDALPVIDKIKSVIEGTNVYTKEAYDTFNAYITKFENAEYTADELGKLHGVLFGTGWRSTAAVDDFLISAWDAEPRAWDTYHVNTWSTTGDSGNPNFVTPCIEYWTGDAGKLADKVMTATVADLTPNGKYSVSIIACPGVNTGENGVAPTGIEMQVGEGTAVSLCTGTRIADTRFYEGTFTAEGNADADGNLVIKINVASTNASWLTFRNVKYTEIPLEPLGTYITFPTTIAFDETTAPFTGGVIKSNDNIGNVLTVHTESNVEPAEAKFDAEVETHGAQPYVLAATDKVTVSFVMYAGWQSGGKNTKFAVKNSAGTELFSYTYNAGTCNVTDVAIGGNTVSGFAAFAAQSKSSNKNANGFDNDRSYVATADNNTTVTLTISGSGAISATFLQKAKSLDKTFNASLSDDVVKDLASLNITSAVTLADRACGFDNFSITKETVEEATYVVKGLVDDTEIYSDTLYAEVGSTPTVAAVDYYDVEKGNKKYIYLDDDASSKTVAKDGSTVVNVFYREAETYKYSIQAVNAEGELLQALSTNSNYEGENITVSYPAYVLNTADSTLYEAAATSSQYNKTIELTEAEQALNITYNKTDITNVIYLQEGEDIWGMTKSTHGNSYVRSSNASAGYPAEGDVDITELSTGKYKLSVVFFNAKSSSHAEFKFTLGGDSLCSLKSTGINKSSNSSDEFTVIGRNLPLTVLQGGSNEQGIDLIYIQKTGVVPPTEVANIGALKDVEEGVEVKLALTDAVVNVWSGAGQSMASYVEDATGAIKFDMALSNLEFMNDSIKMNGYVFATYSKDYDGIPQLSVSDSTSVSKVDTVAAVPASKVMTVAAASADSALSRYVKFENVEFIKKVVDNWGTTECYLVQGTDTIVFFDKFYLFGYNSMPDFKSFTEVQGIISVYDGKFEFYPYGDFKANYTPAVVVENIAAAKAVENGTNVNLTLKDAKITAYVASRWGSATAYIEDASGAIQISGDALSAIGVENDSTILNGNIYVKYASEWGTTQLTPGDSIAYSNVEVKEGAVSPTTLTVKDIKAETNVSRYVEIAFPSFKYDAENYCYIAVQNGDTIKVVDNFGWMSQNFEMDEEYNLVIPDSVSSVRGIVMWDDWNGYSISPIGIDAYVAPQDIVVNVTKGDITAAVETAKAEVEKVGKITVNLTKGAAYTLSGSIIAPASLVINGDSATIDASALGANFIESAAAAEVITVDSIAVLNVTVKGLGKALYYSAGKNIGISNFVVDNSVIEVAKDAIVFDFTKGSAALNFVVKNSTIYAPTATTKSIYSSQYGEKGDAYGATTDAPQTFSFENTTLYNIAYNKNFFTHRSSGQKWMKYVVKNNVIVNSGKANFMTSVNGGQDSANPIYDVTTNSVGTLAEGVYTDLSASQIVKENVMGTLVATNPGFADVAAGNFTVYAGSDQAKEQIGDPRWLVEFDDTVTGIDGVNSTVNVLNGDVFSVNGVKVRNAGDSLKGLAKGLYIINGKKVVVK